MIGLFVGSNGVSMVAADFATAPEYSIHPCSGEHGSFKLVATDPAEFEGEVVVVAFYEQVSAREFHVNAPEAAATDQVDRP